MTEENNQKNTNSVELISFTYFWIGPVQEFIQEARKVHDLFIGSLLLAKASYEIMQILVNNHCEIILPDTSLISANRFSHLPNHCIVKIREHEFQGIIDKVEEKIKRFLPDIADTVISHTKIPAYLKSYNQENKWNAQIKSHFQIAWVSLTTTEADLQSNYLKRYQRLQQLMEERKLTRDFNAWDGYPVDKCNQCGHREILGNEDRKKNNDFWNTLKADPALRFKLKNNEKLCAVCLLKRITKPNDLSRTMKDSSFDSTSDVASRPYKAIISEQLKGVTSFLENTKSLAKTLSIQENILPGDWLYPEGLLIKRLSKDYPFPEKKLPEISSLAEKISLDLKNVYAIIKAKPCKYYAIIAFDADNMGKYLSGEGIPDSKHSPANWQTQQSQTLSKLATSMPDIISDKWLGQAIYSGGDDYLAIGPLEGIFTSIERARTEIITSFHADLTISAAVVIAHHQDNLQKVIHTLRESLTQAKKQYGPEKDTLVVTVRISSGNTISCGYHWNMQVEGNETGVSFVSGFLKTMADWIRKDNISLSPSFVHQLIDESESLYRYHGHDSVSLDADGKKMLYLEARRLLNRHIPDRKKPEPALVEQLLKVLGYAAYPIRSGAGRPGFNVRENYYSALSIIRFLARQEVNEL